MNAHDRALLQCTMELQPEEIEVPENRSRQLNPEAVTQLAESIATLGLQTPITVRKDSGRYILVAGQHRLEACKLLNEASIPCVIFEGDETEARMWELSENLHRAELSRFERDLLIAEWIKLHREKKAKAQDAPSPEHTGGRPDRGINDASRELGIERTRGQRAAKVGEMAPEAQAIVLESFPDNQSKYMQVARAPVDEQVNIAQALAAPQALRVVAPDEPDPEPEPFALDEGASRFDRSPQDATPWLFVPKGARSLPARVAAMVRAQHENWGERYGEDPDDDDADGSLSAATLTSRLWSEVSDWMSSAFFGADTVGQVDHSDVHYAAFSNDPAHPMFTGIIEALGGAEYVKAVLAYDAAHGAWAALGRTRKGQKPKERGPEPQPPKPPTR